MSEISKLDISDEVLMALADGELAGDERARIAKIVANSEAAAARLAAFTSTGRHLSGLFEQPMLEPVPQRLIDTVRGHADHSNNAGQDNVIQLNARTINAPSRRPRDLDVGRSSVHGVGHRRCWRSDVVGRPVKKKISAISLSRVLLRRPMRKISGRGARGSAGT